MSENAATDDEIPPNVATDDEDPPLVGEAAQPNWRQRPGAFRSEESLDRSAGTQLADAGRGAAAGALLDFDDELGGGVKSGFGMAGDYRTERDALRAKKLLAMQRNPEVYGAGKVGGTVAASFIPGVGAARGASVASMAGRGAVEGGLQAAGATDVQGIAGAGDYARTVPTGMVLGGVTAGTVGGASRIAGRGARGDSLPAAREAADTALLRQTNTNLEATLQREGGVARAAATLRKHGVGKGLSGVNATRKQAAAAIEPLSAARDAVEAESERAGVRVDHNAVLRKLRRQRADLSPGISGTDRVRRELRKNESAWRLPDDPPRPMQPHGYVGKQAPAQQGVYEPPAPAPKPTAPEYAGDYSVKDPNVYQAEVIDPSARPYVEGQVVDAPLATRQSTDLAGRPAPLATRQSTDLATPGQAPDMPQPAPTARELIAGQPAPRQLGHGAGEPATSAPRELGEEPRGRTVAEAGKWASDLEASFTSLDPKLAQSNARSVYMGVREEQIKALNKWKPGAGDTYGAQGQDIAALMEAEKGSTKAWAGHDPLSHAPTPAPTWWARLLMASRGRNIIRGALDANLSVENLHLHGGVDTLGRALSGASARAAAPGARQLMVGSASEAMNKVQQAAQQGPEEAAREHYNQSMTNPDYRGATHDDNQ